MELENELLTKKVVEKSLENGLILFYFLFTKTCFRITPPLTISSDEIIKGCKIITNVLDQNRQKAYIIKYHDFYYLTLEQKKIHHVL